VKKTSLMRGKVAPTERNRGEQGLRKKGRGGKGGKKNLTKEKGEKKTCVMFGSFTASETLSKGEGGGIDGRLS